MAAWANSAGGARPHTADGMFGHFGGFPGSWGGVPAGMGEWTLIRYRKRDEQFQGLEVGI